MRLMIVGRLNGHMAEASRIAHQRGAKVVMAGDIEQALTALRGAVGVDLVMVDVTLDVGLLVRSLKAERIATPVIACGVSADVGAAVRAIQAGAREYVPLPPDAELIAAVLAAVAEDSRTLIAADPATARMVRFAEQVAPSDASVLITGESGTGKEVIARHIHSKSRRSDGPFVSVNCAAIPDNLLESELFGHEKGAFTGAAARRIGKFEEANGGTLLLDEISEMDVRLQAKLLRAIQERVIDRLGSNQPVKVDIRLLATSNRDMEAAVRAGQFREDLYFRLNVITLDLPALRQRPADIEPLARHFIAKYADANGLPDRPLSAAALARLKTHGWKGNVRELENTMHRAVLLASGDCIDLDAIILTGASLSTPSPAAMQLTARPSLVSFDDDQFVGRTVADVERDLIIETLGHCLGNRTHAANILGISIRTLRNKLREYTQNGIPVPMPGEGAHAA